jgi:hypothetical protein
MSMPISAMSTWAAARPTPQSSSSWSTAWANGPIAASIWASTAAISALAWSRRDSMVGSRKP